MSGRPLHDAILERDAAAVVDLWQRGYSPTAAECDELRAAISLNRGRRASTVREIERRTAGYRRYLELRDDGASVDDALVIAADEVGLYVEVLRYVVAGKDRRIKPEK